MAVEASWGPGQEKNSVLSKMFSFWHRKLETETEKAETTFRKPLLNGMALTFRKPLLKGMALTFRKPLLKGMALYD